MICACAGHCHPQRPHSKKAKRALPGVLGPIPPRPDFHVFQEVSGRGIRYSPGGVGSTPRRRMSARRNYAADPRSRISAARMLRGPPCVASLAEQPTDRANHGKDSNERDGQRIARRECNDRVRTWIVRSVHSFHAVRTNSGSISLAPSFLALLTALLTGYASIFCAGYDASKLFSFSTSLFAPSSHAP